MQWFKTTNFCFNLTVIVSQEFRSGWAGQVWLRVSFVVVVKAAAASAVTWMLGWGGRVCSSVGSLSPSLVGEGRGGLQFLPSMPLPRQFRSPCNKSACQLTPPAPTHSEQPKGWGRNCSVFYDLPSKVTLHHFCFLLHIRSESLDVQLTFKGREIKLYLVKGETWGHILKPPQLSTIFPKMRCEKQP